MKNLLLLIVLFFCLHVLQAQLLFTTLKPADGLSSRETNCVFRDREGYVWVGTNNGLNRFDGHHFKVWNKLSPGYPNGLGEMITSIIEHRDGKIWFGTNGGIGVFDKYKNTVEEVPLKATYNNHKLAIRKLTHDGEGRLWVTTNMGLLIERNGGLIPVSQLYGFAKQLDTANYIQASFVFDTKRNCFWVGTTAGSYCLDLAHKKLFSANNNPDRLPVLTNEVLNAMAQDKKGNLWYGNSTSGSLNYYDFVSGSHQRISEINNNPAWKLSAGCNSLFVDKNDRLWISTWLYSSFIRYPDGRIEPIPYKRDLPFSVGYGFFNHAYQDVFGNIWLATINGLSKLTAEDFIEDVVQARSYKYYLDVDFANVNVVETDSNAWWLGKMDGLVRYDLKKKEFERFIISSSHLRQNEISSLCWINGELWCGTSNGIYIFNVASKRFRAFDRWPSAYKERSHIYWLMQDKDGFVWFSAWREGVFRYDPRSGNCIRFHTGPWKELTTSNSYAAYQHSRGKIWIGAVNEGVKLFDPISQKATKPVSPLLHTAAVNAITEDRQNFIWLCTSQNGLIKCDSTGRIVDSITRKDGLPLNEFTAVSIDAYGRLWAVSRENLICVLLQTKEVTKVDIPANYSFNDHWISLKRKGKLLYASMLDNVVVINTEKYHQQLPKDVVPLVSAFRVFGKELPVQEGSAVTLKPNQNFFSFDFASPFHRESLSMQYAYKLEGFDKDWVYSGRKLSANYTNVPDGEYTFLVKTTDGKGRWMNDAAKVHITVLSPFWKKWWFVSLLTAIAFLCALWWMKTSERKQQKAAVDETIDYFANSVYGSNSITEICWDIARNCISKLKFEDCIVYLLDEKRNVLVQKAAYGPKNPKEHEIINPIEIEVGKGIVGTAAKTGKPILVSDTSKDPRYIVDDEQRFSELAVPVVHEGRTIGVIDSEHRRKNFFTEEHLKALSTIAAISANKIAEAKAEESARESEIQLLEIKKMLAESQLMALRAQMNPHFVFNCLNSIQECIVTKKYGEASLYLNKFSKLFRSVLNNSSKVMIALAEEINVLELYLELEHMRFDRSFSYTIHVDEELESDEILIPSMLLQPFVENALWHGLMHKEKDRKLGLFFNKKSEHVFECIIEDNGIGRKKALELKEQHNKTKRHVSRGMAICKDRIDLLQKQGQHATLDIIDKYENNGAANGTKVVIELSSFLQ